MECKLSASDNSDCTSMPIIISAPIALTTSIGRLSLNPPSIKTFCPEYIGEKTTGTAILARIASESLPKRMTSF